MEDPDPQLRESLKEMLFDNKKFKWNRLEDLLSNAAKQTNLDLEKLLDEVINLLFSPKGGFLRNEIIEGLTNQIDLLNLKMPKPILFEEAKNELSPIAQSFWMENRRVSNKLLCETLGYKLIYKNYKIGLKNCYLNS